jgi:hypothetical protein
MLCTYRSDSFGSFSPDEGAAGEEVTIRPDHRRYGYQLTAMLCFLIFADNLLGRIEGHEETVSWLSSGRWELMFVSGVLSVVCQLLFWSLGLYVRAIAEPAESRACPRPEFYQRQIPCWP